MAQSELIAYIKEQLDAGVSRADIKAALLSVGWGEKDIEDNLAQANNLLAQVVRPSVFKLVIVLVVVGILIAGAGFSYFYWIATISTLPTRTVENNNPQQEPSSSSSAQQVPPQSVQPAGSPGTDALPYCEDMPSLSSQEIEAAVSRAMATGKYNNAWGDSIQWEGLIDAVGKDIGCNFYQKPPTALSASLQQQVKSATTEQQLRELYANPEVKSDNAVLLLIAANEICPPDILRELSAQPGISFTVASNTNTPPDVLSAMMSDKGLHSALAGNPSTPPDILRLLSKEGVSEQSGVAANPSTPIEILQELSTNTNSFIKLRVIDNKTTTKEILVQMTKDSDNSVSNYALQEIQKRGY